MTESENSRDTRSIVVARLREDLIGPREEAEVLDERPSARYLTGILFPKDNRLPAEEDEDLAEEVGKREEEQGDEAIALHRAFRPSTMGFSFTVSRGTRRIKVEVAGAYYRRGWVQESGEMGSEPDTGELRWKRTPILKQVPIQVQRGYRTLTVHEAEGGTTLLDLAVRMDPHPETGSMGVTIVLMNMAGGGSREEIEETALFQARVRATPEDGFVTPRPAVRRDETEDPDIRINELIYREASEFATGHTCSASWDRNQESCVWVETCWLPETVVYPVGHQGDRELVELLTDDRLFRAGWLSDQNDAELVARELTRLPDAYDAWIERQRRLIEELSLSHLRAQAEANLAECSRSAERIRRGIGLLREQDDVWSAFRLSQRVLNLQYRGEELVWRPFQLAFQLQCLESIAHRGHPDRRLMDLLWFPTGGGKTEAYLALTAFTLILRRLRGQTAEGDSGGTGVLTRYTLRLLTIQQFERAARMICACEALRTGLVPRPSSPETDLGEEPFSIGLWVGSSSTPNTRQEARIAPLKARVLVECPWCGKGLQPPTENEYRPLCGNRDCDFGPEGPPLPVLTVDEDIYDTPPSLLIGTIDKFAQIVRNERTGVLLGARTGHAPPDLILQDELHLITGPLGTIAGLYESAINLICERQGVTPKILGSTATIRRAQSQVRALFDRNVAQFPPPGLNAGNSFFAKEDRKNPGRVYLGITTAGRSAKYALQAVSASVLQSGGSLRRAFGGAEADPYWTLVGYFNSLRELGGALVLMEDDVRDSIRSYAQQRGETEREIEPAQELTSRVPSEEIPEVLNQLTNELGREIPPPDIVLATNMISVGIDVPRLGLMVVNGQPKTMSEYIQSTSRIGRRHPGLVVTVYNAMRIRDRSHYESFLTWHQTLYREVEAASVTPFAARARDRALHAVIVAAARHLVDGLGTAPHLQGLSRQRLEAILEEVVARVDRIEPAERTAVSDEIARLLDHWEQRGKLTRYWKTTHKTGPKSLLISAEEFAALDAEARQEYETLWPTLNSMRDVEPSTEFILRERAIPQ